MRDVENVIRSIKEKYYLLKKNNAEISGGQNIMGHVVTKFVELQKRFDDCNFNSIKLLDEIWYPTCSVMVGQRIEVVIICADFSNRLKELENIMMIKNTNKAIWIAGTKWNLICEEGTYCMDFNQDIVEPASFEKFMLDDMEEE